jgi:hypothetical protein
MACTNGEQYREKPTPPESLARAQSVTEINPTNHGSPSTLIAAKQAIEGLAPKPLPLPPPTSTPLPPPKHSERGSNRAKARATTAKTAARASAAGRKLKLSQQIQALTQCATRSAARTKLISFKLTESSPELNTKLMDLLDKSGKSISLPDKSTLRTHGLVRYDLILLDTFLNRVPKEVRSAHSVSAIPKKPGRRPPPSPRATAAAAAATAPAPAERAKMKGKKPQKPPRSTMIEMAKAAAAMQEDASATSPRTLPTTRPEAMRPQAPFSPGSEAAPPPLPPFPPEESKK